MIEIRSYRRVFDLERRIYSVERFRLNPAGVPVRGVVYCIVAVVLALALTAMPLVGSLARAMPWYLRELILPTLCASAASVVRIEGRTFHLAARGVLGLVLSPRRISGLARASSSGERWLAPDLLLLPDGSDGCLRRFRYEGPGAVLILLEHDRVGVGEHERVGIARRHATLRLRGPREGRRLARGRVIALERGGRLVVEPAPVARP